MKLHTLMISTLMMQIGIINARGDTVFLQAGERTGVGITRARGSECFVITADHVLGNFQTVSIVGYRGLRATGTKERSYAEDIAVLRVSGQSPEICGGQQWHSADMPSLRQSMHWQIEGSNGDGSVRIMDVALGSIDDRFLYVTPSRATDTIYQGMSGSLIKADGQPVGILVEVKRTNASESGRAYRLDYLESTLHSFFASGDPFAGVYGNFQYVAPEESRTVGSCRERVYSTISVSLRPADVKDGKLIGDVEQVQSFVADSSGCNVAATKGQRALAYTYRFQWVMTSSGPSDFDIISRYVNCSGPSKPKCFWNLGDTQGSLKVDADRNITFSNLSGAAVFHRK